MSPPSQPHTSENCETPITVSGEQFPPDLVNLASRPRDGGVHACPGKGGEGLALLLSVSLRAHPPMETKARLRRVKLGRYSTSLERRLV